MSSIVPSSIFHLRRSPLPALSLPWGHVRRASASGPWFTALDQAPDPKVVYDPSLRDAIAVTGLRLPTEAGWEYACRAGTVTAFHGWPANPGGTNRVLRDGT